MLQSEIERLQLQEPTQDVARQLEQKERTFALLRQVLDVLQESSDNDDSGR